LKNSNSPEMRRNTIWALTQIDAPAARKAVRAALQDKDESVREVAIHSISLWRDTEAEKQLLAILQIPNPQLQRVAAEALGRIGNKSAVPILLTISAEKHDRVLEHSLIYALI